MRLLRLPAGAIRAAHVWLLTSLIVPLVLFAGASWYDRTLILRGAGERLLSTTDALAAHAETVMQSAELVLSLQLEAVKYLDWKTISSSEELHRFLVALDQRLPQVDSVFFVDPEGFNSASSRMFPMPRYDVRDREYYVRAKAGERGLIVSAPFRGRANGDIGFVVSQARVIDAQFAGVAAVTMQPSYFYDLYKSVLVGPDSSGVILLRRDGVVLASYPSEISNLNRLSPASETMRAAAERRDMIYDNISSYDHRPKIAAIKWLPGRDLAVVAGIDRDRLLSQWYLHTGIFAVFALLLALALSMTAIVTLRRADDERNSLEALLGETRRRQEAEAALQQAQKMDALGRLTGGVAHDFNNLLTAVLGSLELALRRVTDPGVVRLLNAANTAAQRGAKLTAQMLVFARKQAFDVKVLDINEVVHSVDEMLRRSIGPLVQLSYRLEPGVWLVRTDRIQLELAILNLVVNARDAMPQGGAVTIATRNLTGTGQVELSIADTGEGMSEAVRASAFEPFFSTKGPGKGTGLGLSMVYGFAQQAGGTVSIDSTPELGTTVRVCLPRAEGAELVPTPTKQREAPGVPEQLSVLLVDDDSAAREPTAAMLRELNCVVSDVDSGTAALEILRSSLSLDLLLIDFAMPDMNGAELATAAKELRPNLPIVFITGYAEEHVLERLHQLGVLVVNKPFRLETLAAALRRALPVHPAEAEGMR